MPHIALPPNKPGMVALGAYRPDVYSRIASLANLLLHESNPYSTLSLGDRELIATYVSSLNNCNYCQAAHGSVAAAHLQDPKLVEGVKANFETSALTPKMKSLLRIAGLVQRSGKDVSKSAVESAKREGASDMDVHDSVLIASMFCMFNRYVDGLDTEIPSDMAAFASRGAVIAEKGYIMPVPAKTEPGPLPAGVQEAKFDPPTGSWEDEDVLIDACEGKGEERIAILTWKNGQKTQHTLAEVYKRCPQKVRSTAILDALS